MLLLHTAVGELGDGVEVRPTHSALPRRPLELAHCLIAWGTKGSGIGAFESGLRPQGSTPLCQCANGWAPFAPIPPPKSDCTETPAAS